MTRITSAWQAGVDSRGLELRTTDLVRPKSLGIQNSCWLGITVDYEAWCVSKRKQADQRLKQQRRLDWLLLRPRQRLRPTVWAWTSLSRKAVRLQSGYFCGWGLERYLLWRCYGAKGRCYLAGALTEEERTSGTIAGVIEALGPTTVVQVEGFQEDCDPFDVDIVLVDWPQPLYHHLFSGGTSWPVNAIWPHAEDAMTQVLNYEQLAGAARAWVEEDLVHSEAYQTGLEDAGTGASNVLMQQMLAQMQATATLVTTLQSELEVLKQDRAAGSAEPAPGAGALSKARALSAWRSVDSASRQGSRKQRKRGQRGGRRRRHVHRSVAEDGFGEGTWRRQSQEAVKRPRVAAEPVWLGVRQRGGHGGSIPLENPVRM